MAWEKQQLRRLLNDTGRRMGLGPAAVDELVRRAQFGRWRRGQRIFDAEDTSDLVNFLVAGAVKVTCPTGPGTVCVQMVRPGQFFGLNWYPAREEARIFVATAFTDATAAMFTSEVMARIVAQAPPRAVLQILSYSWRALSRLLYEKCCLLGLRLEDRLLHELGILARDFGRPTPDGGMRIELALTHADLGEFALASRSNVARAMKDLERRGLVLREGRRWVLTRAFFEGNDEHVRRLRRSGFAVPVRRVA